MRNKGKRVIHTITDVLIWSVDTFWLVLVRRNPMLHRKPRVDPRYRHEFRRDELTRDQRDRWYLK